MKNISADELTQKWENLLKKEINADAKVSLIGEDQILVKVFGESVFDVICFFMDLDRDFEPTENGILITL